MADSADVIAGEAGLLKVSGDLNFTSILSLRKKGEKLIAASPDEVEIDFSGVNASGSAAVSLMMCWLRTACRLDKAIHFSNVPDPLERVIAVSGLSGHISFERPHHCCE